MANGKPDCSPVQWKLRCSLAAMAMLGGSACSDSGTADLFDLGPDTPVVIVMIDTLRADHLSSYGYPLKTSPVLDELASRSYVFEQNSTQCNSTFPAITSIFTGVYPKTHRGYLAVPLEGTGGEGAGLVNAAERFRDAGYHTAAVGSHPFWDARDVDGPVLWKGWETLSFIDETIPPAERPLYAREEFTNPRLAKALDKFNATGEGRPLFLWAHYFDPHTDLHGNLYDPPADLRNSFLDHHLEALGIAEIGDALRPLDPLGREAWILANAPEEDIPKYSLAVGRAGYDAEILACDRGVKVLFDRLEQDGILDKAIIIVMADHGENMEEFSDDRRATAFTHGRLYEGVIHTPLMIHLPGQLEERRIGAITQNIDLFPTLMELLDMAPESQFEGKSLVPLMRGTTGEIHELVFSESSASREKAAKSNEIKLISGWRPEHREIYNWKEDPGEVQNQADSFAKDAPQKLVQALEQFRPKTELLIRFTPMAEPYHAEIHWNKTGTVIDRIEGAPDALISEARDSFLWAGTVPTTGMEFSIFPREFRKSEESRWTIKHSAREDLHEAIHLGKTPVSHTPAIPIWKLEKRRRRGRTAYVVDENQQDGTYAVTIEYPGAKHIDCELRYSVPKLATRFELVESEGFAVRQPPHPNFFKADAFDVSHASFKLSTTHPKTPKRLLLRIDGRWPDPKKLSINGRRVDPARLGFLFPRLPEDQRILPYLMGSPGPDEGFAPGSILIWQKVGGGGGKIDASGMSAELAKQLSSIGYLGGDE